MTYNMRALFEQLEYRLSANPRCSVRELQIVLGASRHTIEKSVHYCRRMSFRQYREERLLENTLRLCNSTLSRKEVAFCLGYKSPAAFSRFVKSKTGKTPSQIMNQSSAQRR
jgi:AraC-like DNA-binding protein